FAEADGAGCRLQRNRPAAMPAVVAVHRLLAVQHDGHAVAARSDLVRVPAVGRLGHGLPDHGDIDDGAGAVARVGALVEDVDLVSVVGAYLVAILAAEENAAVGVLI